MSTTATSSKPRAPKQPQDHKPKTPQINDVDDDRVISFDFDDETWTVTSGSVKSLEFLAALEDEDYIVAMRLLLGRDDAARLFKGRSIEDIGAFFDALGEAVDSGNR